MSQTIKFESELENLQIKDIAALRTAAERCGAEWMQDQQTFKTSEGARCCLHAIRLKDTESRGAVAKYEVGVVAGKTNGTYALMFDTDNYTLAHLLTGEGKNVKPLSKLNMLYRLSAARNVAKSRGMSCVETLEADGSITLKASAGQITVGVGAGVSML